MIAAKGMEVQVYEVQAERGQKGCVVPECSDDVKVESRRADDVKPRGGRRSLSPMLTMAFMSSSPKAVLSCISLFHYNITSLHLHPVKPVISYGPLSSFLVVRTLKVRTHYIDLIIKVTAKRYKRKTIQRGGRITKD